MTEEVNKKSTNVEDVLEMVRISSNKGLGNAGTCSTAAATAAKEVTLGSTFELVDGATILVTFQNAITAAGTTLAVTHTPLGASEAVTETAKPIYYRGAALPANLVKAGDRITLRYDGTRYNVVGTIDQDLGGKADNTTVTALAARIGDIEAIIGDASSPDADQIINKVREMIDFFSGIAESDTLAGLLASLKQELEGDMDTALAGKSDKTSTVSDVTYDSATGELKKTINGTTTKVCDVVTSGFRMEYSSSTGIKSLTPVGGAVGAFNNSTGIKAITF